MMTPVEAVVWTKDIYEASVEMLLKVIAEHGEASRRLLLVGHNPGFESLAEHLGGHTLSPEERGKPFPSAGLAVIQLSPAWDALGRGCADSVRVIRPRELTPSSQGDC
jgi:phosphohistidine phosphatase